MAKINKSFDTTSGSMLLVLALVWGGSFYFAEVALKEVPPLTLALHRVFWALPVLAVLVLVKGDQLPRTPSSWLPFIVMGALNNAIPFSLIFWGQTTIESGLAAILNSTTAFFGVILAGVLLADEQITANKVIGTLLGFIGVTVVLGLDSLMQFNIENLSQLAVLGAALSYSLASIWGRRFLSNYSPAANALGMLVGANLLLAPIALLTDGVPQVSLSTDVWTALLTLACISTALAYLLYFQILGRAGSSNLLLVTLLIPPVALGLGSAFLGETIRDSALWGFVLIAIGLVVTDGRLLHSLRYGNH